MMPKMGKLSGYRAVPPEAVAVVLGVREAVVDDRPQLFLDVIENGKLRSIELDIGAARVLTEVWGAHPLVEKFFGGGKDLQ